jgi:hypothetical protein
LHALISKSNQSSKVEQKCRRGSKKECQALGLEKLWEKLTIDGVKCWGRVSVDNQLWQNIQENKKVKIFIWLPSMLV